MMFDRGQRPWRGGVSVLDHWRLEGWIAEHGEDVEMKDGLGLGTCGAPNARQWPPRYGNRARQGGKAQFLLT
jgi:hypothetical protein